jgi:hypothetical protein
MSLRDWLVKGEGKGKKRASDADEDKPKPFESVKRTKVEASELDPMLAKAGVKIQCSGLPCIAASAATTMVGSSLHNASELSYVFVSSGDAAPHLPVPDPKTWKCWQVDGVSKKQWTVFRDRLVNGYADKSGSSYGPAVKTSTGCLLAQKVDQGAGYVQFQMKSKSAGLPGNGKLTWGAHQATVFLFGSQLEQWFVLKKCIAGLPAGDRWEVSHRCHNPNCIEPSHLVIEPKSRNESRKICKYKVVKSKLLCMRYPADG